MRLALSTSAAPGLGLDALLDACGRRGLAAIELVVGHAHGVRPELDAVRVEAVRGAVRERGFEVAAYVAGPEEALSPAAARLSAGLGAPVVIRPGAAAGRDGALARGLASYAEHGARLLLGHGSDPGEVEACRSIVEAAPDGTAALAWEADPGAVDLAAAAPAVLAAGGPWIQHVRLRGGGPESASQNGRGVGELMAALAMAAYDGTLALRPATRHALHAWRLWLERGGGWGCGSSPREQPLTRLGGARTRGGSR